MKQLIISVCIIGSLYAVQLHYYEPILKEAREVVERTNRGKECLGMYAKLARMSTDMTVWRAELEAKYFNFKCTDFIK